MNKPQDINALLITDTVDAGCAAGFEVLHQYVDAELAGLDPTRQQPGLAAHLRSCPACREDYLGLLEAARHFAEPDPTHP
jgi:predicted anti-sigma-YlaC factor YlaD